MDLAAPLHIDGFLSREGLLDLMRRGAVGEITGWAIDADGQVIEGGANARLTSLPVQQPPHSLAVGVARGAVKVRAIRAALQGRILNGLITDEATARQLLAP
jgi:DNA-binding transcriptional regulator LsrR (DeoR family)